MSAAFTPGPWEAEKTCYEGRSSGAFVINARTGKNKTTRAVAHIKRSTVSPMEANARLIAAAPEMLAALIEMVAGDAEAIARAEEIGLPFPPEMLTAYIKACAAIAKATGPHAPLMSWQEKYEARAAERDAGSQL